MTRFHCLRASRLAAAIGGSALVVGMAPAAQAAITEYTNKTAFEAALAPGAYTETNMHGKYPNYSGGLGFSYTVAASGGSYQISPNDLSTGSRGPSTLTFSFGSGIKAFGGYFYNTNSSGSFVSSSFQISLNSNSFTTTKTPTSTTTFYGFISDSVFTNAAITRDSTDFVTAGTVIVGTTASAPVAAPGPLPLLGVGAAFGWSRRLRCRLVGGPPRLLNTIGRPCCRLLWLSAVGERTH
jgi:hypothetical protein